MAQFIKLTSSNSSDELILRTNSILSIHTWWNNGSRIKYKDSESIDVSESVSKVYEAIQYAERLSQTTYIENK